MSNHDSCQSISLPIAGQKKLTKTDVRDDMLLILHMKDDVYFSSFVEIAFHRLANVLAGLDFWLYRKWSFSSLYACIKQKSTRT